MQLLLTGAGGAIVGPLVSQLLGGSSSGLLGRLVAGVLGGIGAGAGADAAGLGALLGSSEMMQMVQSFLEGGVGGGVLSTIVGMVTKGSERLIVIKHDMKSPVHAGLFFFMRHMAGGSFPAIHLLKLPLDM